MKSFSAFILAFALIGSVHAMSAGGGHASGGHASSAGHASAAHSAVPARPASTAHAAPAKPTSPPHATSEPQGTRKPWTWLPWLHGSSSGAPACDKAKDRDCK